MTRIRVDLAASQSSSESLSAATIRRSVRRSKAAKGTGSAKFAATTTSHSEPNASVVMQTKKGIQEPEAETTILSARRNSSRHVKAIGHVQVVATAILHGGLNANDAMLARMELKVHLLVEEVEVSEGVADVVILVDEVDHEAVVDVGVVVDVEAVVGSTNHLAVSRAKATRQATKKSSLMNKFVINFIVHQNFNPVIISNNKL